MRIQIFDVGHGGCALVTSPNGTRVMIDCGFNGRREWYPSVAFGGQHIDLLVVTNLDEDHLDDLPYMWDSVSIGAMFTNPSVSAPALSAMKPKGMRDGVAKMHELLPYLRDGRFGDVPINMHPASAWCYYNQYPWFRETNDLSLAVFLRCGNFTILFTGDLEEGGWKNLLTIPGFASDLASVNVLVASHHGRENGCCAEAFQFLNPHIVIFSDAEKQYETQETCGWYRNRARGIPDFSSSTVMTRKVFTTRSDGCIDIHVSPTGFFNVATERTLGSWPFEDLMTPGHPFSKRLAIGSAA